MHSRQVFADMPCSVGDSSYEFLVISYEQNMNIEDVHPAPTHCSSVDLEYRFSLSYVFIYLLISFHFLCSQILLSKPTKLVTNSR